MDISDDNDSASPYLFVTQGCVHYWWQIIAYVTTVLSDYGLDTGL